MPSVTDGQPEPAVPTGPAGPGAPSRMATAPPPAALPGRREQAARNDAVILQAAREVFLADPKAPMAAVAEHAGVGMSAVYRRYASKEDLLRRLCQDGLQVFIAEATAAAAEPDAARALSRFLERVVAADVHSLTVHLAGTFTPTPQLGADAMQASGLVIDLVDRAHASGQLRPDAGPGDIQLVLEGCAAVRVPDPARTTELRLRYLALLLDGLFPARAGGASGSVPGGPPGQAPGPARDPGPGREPLPFPAPEPGELNWRWAQ